MVKIIIYFYECKEFRFLAMAIVTTFSLNNYQQEKSSFSQRVETLLNSRGCSKAWLANELGVSKQALNHILKHGKKPKFTSEIAILFDVNPHWLQTGEQSLQQKLNISPSTISLYALNDIMQKNDVKNTQHIEKIFLKPENEHQHFAVLLHNYPAMTSKFEEDSILIFDENAPPKNGSYVLAKPNEDHIVLRQFFIENEKIILKPADQSFETIKCDQCEILGTLVETRMRFSI